MEMLRDVTWRTAYGREQLGVILLLMSILGSSIAIFGTLLAVSMASIWSIGPGARLSLLGVSSTILYVIAFGCWVEGEWDEEAKA